MLTRMMLALKNGTWQSVTFVNGQYFVDMLPIIKRGDVLGWSIIGTASVILEDLKMSDGIHSHIKDLLASLNKLHPEDCDVDGCAHCKRIIWAQDYLK